MDTKADTISAKMDTNGHEWTRKQCPFVSPHAPARSQTSKGFRDGFQRRGG
jgi:hypothetical protein